MRLSRPPYILAHPADQFGCGYHRVIRPLEIMSRAGYCAGRAEPTFVDERNLAAIAPSVVVFQRQLEPQQLEMMARYRQILPNAFFVYELDDALSAVPDASYHKPYMSPDVDLKTARAVALCDAVTVTTSDLAQRMASFCAPGTEIRVVPNMLGSDDLLACDTVRKQLFANPPKPSGNRKLRVGWGGGIGHAGDLRLLDPVFSALNDDIEWVFLGMDPTLPLGVNKTFLGATPPQYYLASLASMNVDAILAPLEDNDFNRCKSNLRLLEAAACSYPVIATPISPYFTKSPPIAYADSPEDWIRELRSLIDMTPVQRLSLGAELRQWLERHYVLDTHVEERLMGWLPSGTRTFRPDLTLKPTTSVEIVSQTPIPGYDVTSSLPNACINGTSDIIYIRPGASLTQDQISRLLASPADVAVTVTNDGGPWGFPAANAFTPMDAAATASADRLCASSSSPELIELSAVAGPVMLLRRRVFGAIGLPDFSTLSPEVALLEWSSCARSRGFKVGLCTRVYAGASSPAQTPPGESDMAAVRIAGRWPQGTPQNDLLQQLRSDLELRFHAENYKAIPPANRNDYSAWADMCDTRGPEGLALASDSREACTISIVTYNNSTLLSELEDDPSAWVFFKREGTMHSPDLLPFLQAAIKANPGKFVFYVDHDYLDKAGKRVRPDFKPNTLDRYMLLSRDYVTQGLLIHKTSIFGNSSNDLCNIPGDMLEERLYNFILRYALYVPRDVGHISRALIHIPESLTSSPEIEAAKRAAAQRLWTQTHRPQDKSESNLHILKHPRFPQWNELKHNLTQHPHVTIVIPTKNNLAMIAPCIQSLLAMTSYPNFSVIIVDNGSDSPEVLAFLASITDPRVRVFTHPVPFNWSRINNDAVDLNEHEHPGKTWAYLFLNDDTRIVMPEWLHDMVAIGLDSHVACVGARLTYPHGAVQHIGVVADKALTGHIHKGLSIADPGHNGLAVLTHESTAITGACMLVRTSVFESLGRFDEAFSDNFNDVAFCLEARRAGYINVVAARAEVQHLEGASRQTVMTPAGYQKLVGEGQLLFSKYPEPDPYWNHNLLISSVANGVAVTGMDMQTYSFPPPALPFPSPPRKSYLLLGPHDPVLDEIHDGAAIYQLETAGFFLRIAAPALGNCGPWDIREPERASSDFAKLRLDGIIVTSIGEAPLAILPFLQQLDLPILYRPTDAQAVCPRNDLHVPADKPDEPPLPCDEGWKNHACRQCVLMHGTRHGFVNPFSWRIDWSDFLQPSNIAIDLNHLADPRYKDALTHVFHHLGNEEV